jgi:hypothetical protein
MRRIVDREMFRIECQQCGRFEMDSERLEQMRRSLEETDSGEG